MNLIQQLEKEQLGKLSAGRTIPDFEPGDTVVVNVKVVEGERTRIQAYEGVCIGRSGGGFSVYVGQYKVRVDVSPWWNPDGKRAKVVPTIYFVRGKTTTMHPDVPYPKNGWHGLVCTFANMFVQRVGKGVAILMALGLTAIPIRFLSILALLVIAIWSGFAIYAGRRFDRLAAGDTERRLEEAIA